MVVFGAGATGRAHIGLLASQAGCELVFVDKNRLLVDALRNSGSYHVRVFSTNSHEVTVSGYRIYHHLEREAVAREIADASLVLTAVFPENLPDVALTLALAISERRIRGYTVAINIIACENMDDSSSTLGRHVLALLRGEDLAYAREYAGFPDCMISRVVPQPAPGSPLLLVTEDYNEWTVRKEAFRGEKPEELTAMELVDNQTARLERKLMIHNGGHAVCGYAGLHRGHRYVHEAVADPVVAEAVLGALDELGEVVRRKHGFSQESIDEYKQDLCRRGQIAELRDEILRVVRDPIRKLGRHERLVAPAMLAVGYGLPRKWIVKGIVSALTYGHESDARSVQLAAMLRGEGLDAVLEKVSEISPEHTLAREIREAWSEARAQTV